MMRSRLSAAAAALKSLILVWLLPNTTLMEMMSLLGAQKSVEEVRTTTKSYFKLFGSYFCSSLSQFLLSLSLFSRFLDIRQESFNQTGS